LGWIDPLANLNPHFHTLMIDGVYAYADGDAAPLSVPAPQLTDEDVRQLVETVATRVLRLLERRGILDGDELDPLAERSPVLAGMTVASVQGLVATGERAGRIVRRVLSDPAAAVRTSALCFASRLFPARRHADRGRRQSRSRKALPLRGKTTARRGKVGAAQRRQALLRAQDTLG
jgi:hypothetical protein